jgi:phosphatidylserine/phosphatidylglycerophosphate/cardiolipin synthase-like enzyme
MVAGGHIGTGEAVSSSDEGVDQGDGWPGLVPYRSRARQRRHRARSTARDVSAWSDGNEVTPLVHGATYFARLLEVISAAGPGDLIMFTDWRGNPDQLLDGPQTEVARVLSEAAARGVIVKGLIWRSHWDRLQVQRGTEPASGRKDQRRGR